jgi:hypothetical protein
MSTGPRELAFEAVRKSLNGLLSQCAAPDRLLELLGYLDARRSVDMVEHLAHSCKHLGESVAQAIRHEEAPPAAAIELAAACEAYVRSHGWEGRRRPELGHIGWSEVISDFRGLSEGYGFTSRHSIATFEELLRYVAAACRSLTRILLGSRELVGTLRETAGAPARGEWDALAPLISRDIVQWTKTRETIDRAAHTVSEVLTRTEDFEQQREALAERAGSERDESVARLVTAIAKLHSPWAWLVKSPASRLSCLELAGGYKLRLGFEEGLFREVELGAEYWSTTGLEIDPESFGSVRIDKELNRLVWSNGFSDSGERLHLAILEGRLAARAIGPIGAYEIVPGRSIGPFELGMTKERIEKGLTVRPMRRLENGSAFFPLIEVSEVELARWDSYPLVGVTVSYDASGRCCKIDAVFSWFVEPPIFTMLGQLVNGMSYKASIALLQTIASDVSWVYGSVRSDSAGVSAGLFEATDQHIMNVTITPPKKTG